ncbi:putative regulator of chromosome condensation, RCC1 [Roseibium sp. TrichSKD4]|uniref:hypothetical protein n=1 Tax=Roseibium sp. TrichSKD4 TaxID=744980 RepID=UPI0001E56C9B|nr:hypothetical protein [Roseibium sp. TrichSKD4]EFO33211.1 putative regulator of chromosome condensation, RCC1 [Roseibium sp. TrichSKD4]
MQIDLGKIKIAWKGAYDPEATYERDDAVFYDGSSFIFVGTDPKTGVDPTDTATWNIMAQGYAQSKLVWAGGPNGHSHASAAGSSLDISSTHVEADPAYASVDNSVITIQKPGFYRVGGYVMQHTNSGHRYFQIRHNANTVQYNYMYGAYWMTTTADYTAYFNEGDTISFHAWATGTNLYAAHSHGYYTRFFLTYMGD